MIPNIPNTESAINMDFINKSIDTPSILLGRKNIAIKDKENTICTNPRVAQENFPLLFSNFSNTPMARKGKNGYIGIRYMSSLLLKLEKTKIVETTAENINFSKTLNFLKLKNPYPIAPIV